MNLQSAFYTPSQLGENEGNELLGVSLLVFLVVNSSLDPPLHFTEFTHPNGNAFL